MTLCECENGNDICANLRLATSCVCRKEWCKKQLERWTNNLKDGEGTNKETPDTSKTEGIGASMTGKRSPLGDCGAERNSGGADAGRKC